MGAYLEGLEDQGGDDPRHPCRAPRENDSFFTAPILQRHPGPFEHVYEHWMDNNERRRSHRHTAALNVTLHVGGGGRSLKGQSVDVSRSGIFVVVPAPISAGSRVDMLVDPGEVGSALSLRGRVVHVVRGTGVGIRFGELSTTARERLNGLIDRLRASAERDKEITDQTVFESPHLAPAMNSDAPPRRSR